MHLRGQLPKLSAHRPGIAPCHSSVGLNNPGLRPSHFLVSTTILRARLSLPKTRSLFFWNEARPAMLGDLIMEKLPLARFGSFALSR